MTPTEELARSRYALLTSYRRDGRPVSTPVWVVPLDGVLAIWTARRTGKVRRIRRNPAVTLATCDFQGNNVGEPRAATAWILDTAGSGVTRQAIRRKYGAVGRLTLLSSRLRGGLDRTVGIGVAIDPSSE